MLKTFYAVAIVPFACWVARAQSPCTSYVLRAISETTDVAGGQVSFRVDGQPAGCVALGDFLIHQPTDDWLTIIKESSETIPVHRVINAYGELSVGYNSSGAVRNASVSVTHSSGQPVGTFTVWQMNSLGYSRHEFVRRIFHEILNRRADVTKASSWLTAVVDNAPATRIPVIQEAMNSTEWWNSGYRALANYYILYGLLPAQMDQGSWHSSAAKIQNGTDIHAAPRSGRVATQL